MGKHEYDSMFERKMSHRIFLFQRFIYELF